MGLYQTNRRVDVSNVVICQKIRKHKANDRHGFNGWKHKALARATACSSDYRGRGGGRHSALGSTTVVKQAALRQLHSRIDISIYGAL